MSALFLYDADNDRSTRITDEDIAKGAYDGAEVALYLVDWTDPELRLLVSRGLIGEITNACRLLRRMGPPADRLWAVEPTGVLTITPSQL